MPLCAEFRPNSENDDRSSPLRSASVSLGKESSRLICSSRRQRISQISSSAATAFDRPAFAPGGRASRRTTPPASSSWQGSGRSRAPHDTEPRDSALPRLACRSCRCSCATRVCHSRLCFRFIPGRPGRFRQLGSCPDQSAGRFFDLRGVDFRRLNLLKGGCFPPIDRRSRANRICTRSRTPSFAKASILSCATRPPALQHPRRGRLPALEPGHRPAPPTGPVRTPWRGAPRAMRLGRSGSRRAARPGFRHRRTSHRGEGFRHSHAGARSPSGRRRSPRHSRQRWSHLETRLAVAARVCRPPRLPARL